ncbi:hypothetical protein NCER_101980 [Vairimorpha ceranae BRL01]|uniref:Uncharacterized protein n=1 Tax=Vairimorpha ceranae (strain BRL01) TaxID=578460 RepID=C4VB55_VAIC1|nr:hypothetical protein NCER_101980 [Vairimorpha ceranae BRL01]
MLQGPRLVGRYMNPRKNFTEIRQLVVRYQTGVSMDLVFGYSGMCLMTVMDLHHPRRNARASLACYDLPRRFFICNLLLKVSEYDLQMLPHLRQLSCQPKDVMPILHL